MRRISAAAMPQCAATASGANSFASVRTASRFSTSSRAAPSSTSSSSNKVCTSASRNAASLPGRMKWCSLAIFAVSVRRGSITTILPPRSSTARSRFGASGMVMRLPCEIIGFAPMISRCCVRSTSGTGTAIGNGRPNMRPVCTIFGSVSIAAELNWLFVASAWRSTGRYSTAPRSCTTGLPV